MAINKTLFTILDLVMSEYGWSVEYCMKLPHDVLESFYDAILERKRNEQYIQTKLWAFAVNAGFSGKIESIDKIFKTNTTAAKDEVPDKAAWKAQLKGLWIKMKRDPEEFEKKWAAGEPITL